LLPAHGETAAQVFGVRGEGLQFVHGAHREFAASVGRTTKIRPPPDSPPSNAKVFHETKCANPR
jgi:hypothetical protein